MKKIYLARHATTNPAKGNQKDRDRTLTDRGLGEANWLGEKINSFSAPELIVSSSAERTRETSELIQKTLEKEIKIEFLSDLYLASPEVILKRIKSLSNKIDTIVLVGHNPGLSQVLITASNPNSNQSVLRRVYGGLPPAGLATLESNCTDWAELNRDNTKLLSLMHPGE